MARATSTAIAIAEDFTADVGRQLAEHGFGYSVVKKVTREVLQQEDGLTYLVRFDGPIAKSNMDPSNSKFKGADGVGLVPDVAEVTNLANGESCILICNTVLSSELQRSYPEHSYVGRAFAFRRGPGQHDRRYKVFQIIEIDVNGKPTNAIDATGADAIDRAKGKK